MDCLVTGWGTGPYGKTPWGGSLEGAPGGTIPSTSDFDSYCVGPCGPMSFITTYDEVDEEGDALQYLIIPETLDLQIGSGGTFPTTDARLIISTSVPEAFTFDFTARFEALPTDFSNLVYKHMFIGVADAAGYCAGLFFSKAGLAYTGSIHHTSGALSDQNMVLDSVVQPIPGSDLLISEGEYYSYRIVVDGFTATTYIFITKTSELPILGHQLRFVLPSIPSDTCSTLPPDRTFISLRGTVGYPAILSLDSICLGAGLIIPNLPPIADAGADQAARTCSIIQLDGSKSYDPEEGSITYKWRLIDAPLGSIFLFDGLDGNTYDTLSNFTNKFYSASLSTLNLEDPIVFGVLGDVLVVDGHAYTIELVSTDINGFYVQIQGVFLPDDLTNVAFKLIRQRSISEATSPKPTFYPDLPGFYKFDLVVSDGQLLSPAAVTIVSVSESPVPRGCIPDVSFIWNYLSDIWGMYDDRLPIEVTWGAFAQVAAAELLTLWQIDYSKSLRDVQRTFQRRWLHYDLEVKEPFPETTSLKMSLGGMRQLFPVTGMPGIPGTKLTITIPVLNKTSAITFTGAGTLTAQQVADQLLPFLLGIDARFEVQIIANRVPPGLTNTIELRIDAPFTFHNDPTDTAPIFQYPAASLMLEGAGAGVGVKGYKVDRSLRDLGVEEGDLLALDGLCYKIARVVDDPSDEWPFQRLTLLDELPIAPTTSWKIPGKVSSNFLDFYNALAWVNDLVTFEVFNENTSEEMFITISGAYVVPSAPTVVGVDLTVLTNYLLDGAFEVLFYSLKRLSYIPIETLVVDIPYLQEKIKSTDDTAVLRRNLDFYIDDYRGQHAIRFAFEGFGSSKDIWQDSTTVPARLWAEVTYLDNKPVIEANFGIPAGFTLDDLTKLPSSVDYLSIVRGLWYAYFKGPTLFNMRAGTQILLGLPAAEEVGVIKEIRSDFSTTQGRILITDKATPEVIRSYTYPAGLSLEVNPATGKPYAVGDMVERFAPLVTGVSIVDYIKDPKWFEGYLTQGTLFEVEKFFRFMVRVDSAAFSLSTLLFVKAFILRIKPTYTYPLFVVLRSIGDTEISTTDEVTYSGVLALHDGACTNGMLGAATMWDEPRPAGGGWRSQYDTGVDPNNPLVYPTAQPVQWGFDKDLLCPEDYIDCQVCITWAGGVPTFDSIFAWDTEIFSSVPIVFSDANITAVPASGIVLFSPFTVTANASLTELCLTIDGSPQASDPNYTIIVSQNGTDVATFSFVELEGAPLYQATFTFSPAISVVIGDLLSVRIVPDTGPTSPYWQNIVVEIGSSVAWSYDTVLAAGTYCIYKAL